MTEAFGLEPTAGLPRPMAHRQISLVDLLDRLLGTGVVLAGDLTLRIADVDLVRVQLHALVASVGTSVSSPWQEPPAAPEPGAPEEDEP